MTYEEIQQVIQEAARRTEVRLLRQALRDHNWNVTRTAKALACTQQTLTKAVHRHPELAAKISGRGRPKGKK